jgi:hypothetical protein
MTFTLVQELEDPVVTPYTIAGYTQNQQPWKSKAFKVNFGRIYRAPFSDYNGF